MAEFIMKDLVRRRGIADKYHIESCATSAEELGSDTYPPAKEELSRRGIPFEKRRARQIKSSDYSDFDYLIAMDSRNIRNIERFVNGDPEGKVSLMMEYAGENRDVDDPWYTGDFRTTYLDLVKACEGLLDSLS